MTLGNKGKKASPLNYIAKIIHLYLLKFMSPPTYQLESGLVHGTPNMCLKAGGVKPAGILDFWFNVVRHNPL